MSYFHHLVPKRMAFYDLFKLIFLHHGREAENDFERNYNSFISSSIPFCLRWVKASKPNLKDWSHTVADSRVVPVVPL